MPRPRSPVPADLLEDAARFRSRRRRRTTRGFPDPLWRLAARLAARHGVCATVRALALDYCTLARRARPGAAREAARVASADPPASGSPCGTSTDRAAGERWKQYTGRVVVIVDAGVRSAGETVAGMLKEDGRAYVIGPEATAGSSSQKEEVLVPSGKVTVRISVASHMGRLDGGKGIEGIGIPPHEVVPHDPEELRAGVDTQSGGPRNSSHAASRRASWTTDHPGETVPPPAPAGRDPG